MTKKQINKVKAEVITSVAFSILLFILSWTDIVYIPISNERILDLSLVPAMFVAMIGGYKIAIPVAIGWTFSSILNLPGEIYEWQWIFATKLLFCVSLVYFYAMFKRIYKASPWNVYRTAIVGVVLKNITIGIAMLYSFPDLKPSHWIQDIAIATAIELAICMLAMSLIIDKLRQIHILNGIKRKKK